MVGYLLGLAPYRSLFEEVPTLWHSFDRTKSTKHEIPCTLQAPQFGYCARIYNPIPTMGFLAMFTFQLDNIGKNCRHPIDVMGHCAPLNFLLSLSGCNQT